MGEVNELERLEKAATPGPWVATRTEADYASGVDAPGDRGVPGAVGSVVRSAGPSRAARSTRLRRAVPCRRSHPRAHRRLREGGRARTTPWTGRKLIT